MEWTMNFPVNAVVHLHKTYLRGLSSGQCIFKYLLRMAYNHAKERIDLPQPLTRIEMEVL